MRATIVSSDSRTVSSLITNDLTATNYSNGTFVESTAKDNSDTGKPNRPCQSHAH